MSLTAAVSGFVVLLLSVPVMCGLNSWRVTYKPAQICAFKGSTVKIHSTYKYPSTANPVSLAEKTFWFTKESNGVYVDLRTDSEYSGRVQYDCVGYTCTLTITDLRESDSAQYYFRILTVQPDGKYTGSPGVSLSVSDLQVQVSRLEVKQQHTWAELTCHSSCPLPGSPLFIWYKNGQKFSGPSPLSYLDTIYDSADSYSCAVEGHEDVPSPSLLMQGENGWEVTYKPTEICAFRGSTVSLRCTYRYPFTDHPAQPRLETCWFRTESDGACVDLRTDSEYSGRVQNHCENNDCTLTITDLKESDSAEYKFSFITNLQGERYTGSPGVALSVKDPQLQVHVRRSAVNPYVTWTELTCHSECPLPDRSFYIWYKNGHKVKDEKVYFHPHPLNPADNYYCAVKGYEMFHSPSVYAPKHPSVSVNHSAEIEEGSSVTLSCSSDANPAANYTWYKNQTLFSEGPQFVFSSIQSSDYGQYCCVAENELGRRMSTYVFINVKYAPKTCDVSVSPSAEIEEGSSVTLTCSSDANPAANYTWYNENQTVLSEGPQFVFSSIQSSDYGQYCCVAENELGRRTSTYVFINVKYAPKTCDVSVSPSEIEEGSSVTLTCSSDANPAANYTWHKENQTLVHGPEGNYNFASISSEDSGMYYCKSENQYGQINSSSLIIDVQYAPKRPSVSVSPSAEIVEGSSVTLSCSSDANPAANYTWYKENQTLVQGPDGIHHVTSIRSEDSGIYHCKSENPHGQINSTSVFIDVQYAPKRPSVSVSPSKIVEGSSVTLSCSSDANPAANYTWYKENKESPKASGQIFIITDFRAEHSGNYYCEAENTRGQRNATLQLIVVAAFPEAWKIVAVGTAPGFVLVIIWHSVFFLIRKRRASKKPSKPGERADNREQSADQGDLHYASVQFVKNQTDPVYSNIGPTGLHIDEEEEEEEEEEEVKYATVNFNSAGPLLRTSDQESVEDPAAVYSTVSKTT